jgi:hypothetical protein
MLMKRNSKQKIEIEFGNLKEDFKSNFYLATNERAVENKRYKGIITGENYVVLYDKEIPNGRRYINLNYFEQYMITYV